MVFTTLRTLQGNVADFLGAIDIGYRHAPYFPTQGAQVVDLATRAMGNSLGWNMTRVSRHAARFGPRGFKNGQAPRPAGGGEHAPAP